MNELTEKLTDVQNRVNIIESTASETGTQADVNRAATDEATPQSVRLDADLQQRIDQRLRELDIGDHDLDEDERLPARGKSRPLRSGRDKTAAESVSVAVEWPHYHVFRGADRRPAKYDELTITEFVAGYLKIVLANLAETKNVTLMLKHLGNIMGDVTEHSWENVRNCHAIILQQMEQARLNWADTDSITELRTTYAHARPKITVDHYRQASRTNGPLFCFRYQSESCTYDSDHTTSRGFVKHVCAYCLKTYGVLRKHAEQVCRQKSREATSKNAEELKVFYQTSATNHLFVTDLF